MFHKQEVCFFFKLPYLCLMLRITTHIEKLLLIHDCVIIPEIGGFVLQTNPATYTKVEHAFTPMHKEVVFNKALQHNDGLLSESYMQSYGLEYRKAQQMLEEDINDMKSSLQQYNKVSLGNIGALTKEKEGQLVFHAGKTEIFDVDHYGLSSFHFPVLPAIDTEDPSIGLPAIGKKRKEILYIPVNRRFIRGIVATVAALALFLIISTPVKDVNQAAYTASFVPSEIILPKAIINETAISNIEVPSQLAESSSTSSGNLSSNAVSSKMYHIIIGSFPSEDQAKEFLAKHVDHTAYPQAGIVTRDERSRIYAKRYDNRKDAESYLETIRQNEKYKDAWLFISRRQANDQ